MPTFHETIANTTIEQAFDQTQLLNQRLSSVRLGAQGFQLIGMNAEPLAYDKDGKKSADPKDLKTVIQQDRPTNWSAWALGSGIFGKMTDVSQIPNGHSESGSCLIGADYRWSDSFTTGLYGGYEGTYAEYANKSSNRMNSALFGGYASYKAGGFYTDAVVGGGYNAYNVRRTIEFSTIKRTAQSDQQSGQLNAALNFGYDWKVSGFTLGPVLGAQYTYVGIAPFTDELLVGSTEARCKRNGRGVVNDVIHFFERQDVRFRRDTLIQSNCSRERHLVFENGLTMPLRIVFLEQVNLLRGQSTDLELVDAWHHREEAIEWIIQIDFENNTLFHDFF